MPNPTSGQADQKTLFFISNSHLDTQWNWDVKTTINEYVRNFVATGATISKWQPPSVSCSRWWSNNKCGIEQSTQSRISFIISKS